MKYTARTGKTWHIPEVFLLMVALALVFSAGPASASEGGRQGEAALLDTYRSNMDKLEANSFGLPLFLESFERGDNINADVYGIFDYPFSSIANALKVPANWCDVVPLHPNVKACTFRELSGDWLLTFYIGRKFYQPVSKTRRVIYRYRSVAQQQSYIDISLSADTGPFGTRDHRMRFEAAPIENGRTFVHVSYSYNDSLALRTAKKIYLSTIGRGKVGFTVTGTDKDGNPVYVGGPRGVIERNAVRYYFAIQSFMRYPAEENLSLRLTEWYDLTTRFRKQLFDLEKKDYLTFKAAEYKDQSELQKSIGKSE